MRSIWKGEIQTQLRTWKGAIQTLLSTWKIAMQTLLRTWSGYIVSRTNKNAIPVNKNKLVFKPTFFTESALGSLLSGSPDVRPSLI